MDGDNPVLALGVAVYGPFSMSRVAWDCSSKWVVNSI
jgi:hypothetical protein